MQLTLTLDDETARKAEQAARAMDKTLEQAVRDYLDRLARQDEIERDIAEWRALSGQGEADPGWRFSRDEIYDRKILR